MSGKAWHVMGFETHSSLSHLIVRYSAIILKRLFIGFFIEEQNLKVWSQLTQKQKIIKESQYLLICLFDRI